MQFNKLYNLILQSIIAEGKEYRRNILKKRFGQNKDQINETLNWLQEHFDNKTGDLLAKFIANDSLDMSGTNYDIQKVAKILKLQPSIDIQSFNGTMQQFISQYYDVVTKAQQKQAAKNINQLDNIPQFSQKETYDNGVVIYKVDDTEEGMNAVRKIVDLQWGLNSNPWCIIARYRKKMTRAWSYWKTYRGYPKHIAFQNGKLLALSANRDEQNKWWDRNDNPSNELILLDGSKLQTKEYGYGGDKIESFIKKNNLVLNEQTGRYDSQGDVEVLDSNLINGHFPLKFGHIKGNFSTNACQKLNSLENGPTEVDGACSFYGQFKTMKGAPVRVGDLLAIGSLVLESLEGCTQEVGGDFAIRYTNWLKTLQGGPRKVGGDYTVSSYALTSLQGAPGLINGEFEISNSPQLTDFRGGPQRVLGNFYCFQLSGLKSLRGSPRFVKRDYIIKQCPNVTSFDGAPDFVLGKIKIGSQIKLFDSDKNYYTNIERIMN